MKEKKDNIYIYIWEEQNTVYIGRTINPKSRHYQHKHIPTERTYKFSSEHGVEHPKMIIIENDLTIEEGVGREKYWIEHYRTNGAYNVLNKSCGGQIGSQKTNLTEEEILEHQKEYRRKNRSLINERQRKYYEKHKEERKRYYELNKDKIKEYEDEYRKSHRNEILNSKKKYREKNRDKIREKAREYRRKNKSSYSKSYYETHKEKIKSYQKCYREKHREELLSKKREYNKLKNRNIS